MRSQALWGHLPQGAVPVTPQYRSVVVIPTYEEAANVREVLDAVLSHPPSAVPLLLNARDGGPDDVP
jgi:hypothetical protein